MNAKIITFANIRRGVGKTTSVLETGKELIARGKKVLFVDLDEQATLTERLGVEWWRGGKTVADFMGIMEYGEKPCAFEDAIVRLKDYDLLPSSMALYKLDGKFMLIEKKYEVLKRVLEKVRTMYDYILIDTPSLHNMMLMNGIYASDWMIIPLTLENSWEISIKFFIDMLTYSYVLKEKDFSKISILLTKTEGNKKFMERKEKLEEYAKSKGLCVFETHIRSLK